MKNEHMEQELGKKKKKDYKVQQPSSINNRAENMKLPYAQTHLHTMRANSTRS